MKTCLKLMQILFVGFSILFSVDVYAQFKGCHAYCGRKANDAWAREHGNTPAPSSFTKPIYDDCMDYTLNVEKKTSDADCNGLSSNNIPTPSANPNRCQAEYSNAIQQCQSAVSSTKSTCDETTSSAFSSTPSTDKSTDGVADSCSAAGSLSGSAKSAWTSFKNSCESARSSCLDSCEAIRKWANANPDCVAALGKTNAQIDSQDYSPNQAACLEADSHIATADNNIKKYGDNASTSQACNDSTTGGSGGGDKKNTIAGMDANGLTSLAGMLMGMAGQKKTEAAAALVSFCQANPAYPGCSASAGVNCNDATMASTNKVCICAANPRDPQCATYTTASEAQGTASIDSSSRLPAQNQADLGGDMPTLPNIPMGPPAKSGDAADVGGRQGAGAPVGGGQAGLGSNGLNRNTAVNPGADPTGGPGGSGFYGASGGSGGKGAGGGGVGAPIAGAPYRPSGSVGSGPNGTGAPNGQPDLRQFLPGGVQDPRARMMMGGSGLIGQDGVTGPHTNNWEKMQNRYRLLQTTLIPN